LLGLLDATDEGVVTVRGEDARSLSEDERSDLRRDRFGFIFQTFNLIAVLSSEENVGYPMALAGVGADERRARARQLLEAVGLGGKGGGRPHLLPGGQGQRAAVGPALANRPALGFADQPAANPDPPDGRPVLPRLRQAS